MNFTLQLIDKWLVTHRTKPIPTTAHDWEGVHVDYDGPGDDRFFTGPTREDIESQIEEYELTTGDR